MRRFVVVLFVFLSFLPADDGYQMPPKELAALVEAPPTPSMLVGPGDYAVLTEAPLFLTIADLAQPELKLAGLRFNPRNHEQTRSPYNRDLRVVQLSTGESKPLAGLPSPLRARYVTWSANGKQFAFTHATEDALELWAGDAAAAKARRVGTIVLNGTSSTRPFHWLGDDAFVARLASNSSCPARRRSSTKSCAAESATASGWPSADTRTARS